MIKGSFTLKGKKLPEDLEKVLSRKTTEYQGFSYTFDSGSVFVFSVEDTLTADIVTVSIFVDHSLYLADQKELRLICSAVSPVSLALCAFQRSVKHAERRQMEKFHDLVHRFCKGYDWTISPLQTEE